MIRQPEYGIRVPKTINIELYVWNEFQRLCNKEQTSISKKLQSLMIEELGKKREQSSAQVS
jgi:macrodomain Ter protein organizer (MatP/YcbG family)